MPYLHAIRDNYRFLKRGIPGASPLRPSACGLRPSGSARRRWWTESTLPLSPTCAFFPCLCGGRIMPFRAPCEPRSALQSRNILSFLQEAPKESRGTGPKRTKEHAQKNIVRVASFRPFSFLSATGISVAAEGRAKSLCDLRGNDCRFCWNGISGCFCIPASCPFVDFVVSRKEKRWTESTLPRPPIPCVPL